MAGARTSTDPRDVARANRQKRRDRALRQLGQMFPHIPDPLLKAAIGAYLDDPNDADGILEAVRGHDRYDEFFPGAVNEDGVQVVDERTYYATTTAYDIALEDAGLNPKLFNKRYGEWIAGDVSVNELTSRLDKLSTVVDAWGDNVIGWYADNYGIKMTKEAVMAAMADPELDDAIVNRRIGMAEIGGAASRYGYDIGRQRARALYRRGVTGDLADMMYEQAEDDLGTLRALDQRYAGEGGVTRRGYENTFLNERGDIRNSERYRSLYDQSKSDFSAQGGVADDPRSGGIDGLRQR